MKKRVGAALLFIFLMINLWSQTKSSKKIRVGYFYDTVFHLGQNSKSFKSGYAYDYYQTITNHLDWEYEYVYGSWSDIYNKLLDGSVDIVADISRTKTRENQMLFSALPMGDEQTYLFNLATNQNDDVLDLNGKRIAVDEKTIELDFLKQFLSENNYSCEIILTSGVTDRLDMLRKNKIDYMVDSSSLTEKDCLPVLQIGSGNIYFAVNKNRPDILEDLNHAMVEIMKLNPNFHNELRYKYCRNPRHQFVLTEKENDWLKNNPVIRIGYKDDCMPLSDFSRDFESIDGLLKDIIVQFSISLKTSFETVRFENNNQMAEALRDNKVDIVFPVMDNVFVAEQMGYKQSQVVLEEPMVLIYKGFYKGINEYKTFGYCYGDPYQRAYVFQNDLADNLICFDSIKECLQAISKGNIDCVVMNYSNWSYYVQNHPTADRFETVYLPKNSGFCFAVAKGNHELLKIINTCISQIDVTNLSDSMNDYVKTGSEYNFVNFIRYNKKVFWGIIILLIIVVLIAGHYIQNNKLQKKYLQFSSEHDGLTGVYNRTGFYRLSAQRDEETKQLCFAIIDIDDFKHINDSYGHEAGDKVIKHIADLLTHSVRSGDKVIRYGGDEFVVMLYGLTPEASSVVQKKIENLNFILQNPKGSIPVSSISVGAAFSSDGYSKDLFNRADEALYDTKKRGKKGITIV